MNAPKRRADALVPLDPYLGRRQLWGKQAERLLRHLPEGPVDPLWVDYLESIAKPTEPARSLVLRDRSPLLSLGSQAARTAIGGGNAIVSWTCISRQSRLASLPLLVRKTVLEIRSRLKSPLPVPDRLDEGFDWLRGTLIAADQPVVIIWDGLDLADQLDEAGSWFWFTSPWPSHVRVIATLSSLPTGDSLADFWSRSDLVAHEVAPPETNETLTNHWTKEADQVAAVLACAADGRSSAELEQILAPMPAKSVAAGLAELRPWLAETEEDRWILSRLPGRPTVDRARGMRQTIEFLTPLARRDRSIEAELAILLMQSEDLSHRQAARRHLQSQPLLWLLWTRDRADLVQMVRAWETSSQGAWAHLTQNARSAAGVEPHHLMAYGDILEQLGQWAEARELYLESAERAQEKGALFHEQAALRRAADCSLRLEDYESALALTPIPSADADLRLYGAAAFVRAEALTQLGRTTEAWDVLADLEKRSFEANSPWHQIESLSRQASLAESRADATASANIDAQLLILGRTAPVGLPFVQALAREAKRKIDQNDEATAETLAQELHRGAVIVASAENVGLALGMLAAIADHKGQWEGSAQLLAAKEKLCRQVGDLEGVASTMLARAGVLGLRLGRKEAAEELIRSATRIARPLEASEILARLEDLERRLTRRASAG